MDKEYSYIIFEKNNKEISKSISKLLKMIKDDYEVVKHFNIGNFSIYRIYKSFDKYYEHKLYSTCENKEYFLELDFDELDPIQSEAIKRLILESNLSSLTEDKKSILVQSLSAYILSNDEKKEFLYYDKKGKKLYLGKFGKKAPVFVLEDDNGSRITTNSEYLRKLLKENYKTSSILNGEDAIYEITNNGDYKRNDIANETEENLEIESDKNLKKLLNESITGIESVLKKGEFITDKVYSLNPSLGREEEIKELEKNLMIPKKGVLLVGKTGVGKTAIVEGLAYKIRGKEVCDRLKNKRIFSISISNLTAGTRYRGDLEEKIEKLCMYIKHHPEIILFLDEMHAGINDNNYESGTISISDILKPYISKGELKIIGITTDEEFEILRKSDAFLRRFNILEIEEMDKNKLIRILTEHIYFNEFDIDISMTEEEILRLCNIVIKLSKRKPKYIYKERSNPDSSINIIDNCFAHIAVNNIKNAGYNDFIDGIINNKNLGITELDLPMLKKGKQKDEPTKIIKLTKNNLL
ncbi:MAG: ATP-dependent Clp protease ATP-binding subunit [Bacilli bacterium]|nr:ATP-dependent Clp protease ATP-binding subunit [Bacilli bacterium]